MGRLRCKLAALLAVAMAGCGGDGLVRVAVKGKLTAQGKPLDGAVVQFIPMEATKGEGAVGRSDDDGNFTMVGTRDQKGGVVPGEYKVRVSRLVLPDGTPMPTDAKPAETGARESLAKQFTTIADTPLKCTVPAGGGVVDIDVPEKPLRFQK